MSARKDTGFYRFSKQLRRNRKLVLVASLAMMTGTGAIIGWDYLRADASVRSFLRRRRRLRVFRVTRPSPSSRPTGTEWPTCGAARTTTTRISISATDGGSTVPADDERGRRPQPRFSPEGKRVAFLRVAPIETEIYVLPPAVAFMAPSPLFSDPYRGCRAESRLVT